MDDWTRRRFASRKIATWKRYAKRGSRKSGVNFKQGILTSWSSLLLVSFEWKNLIETSNNITLILWMKNKRMTAVKFDDTISFKNIRIKSRNAESSWIFVVQFYLDLANNKIRKISRVVEARLINFCPGNFQNYSHSDRRPRISQVSKIRSREINRVP